MEHNYNHIKQKYFFKILQKCIELSTFLKLIKIIRGQSLMFI